MRDLHPQWSSWTTPSGTIFSSTIDYGSVLDAVIAFEMMLDAAILDEVDEDGEIVRYFVDQWGHA